MTNKDIALELLEIKIGISTIAEKQHEDSLRTDEIYDRVFKNGLITDVEKTKIQLEHIEIWKKNIKKNTNRIVVSTITAIIVGGLSLLFLGNANGINFSKFFE